MSEYVVLIPANEADWEAASDADREAMYAKHREFSELLAERGHKMTGGHELTHSRTAHIVSGSREAVTVTEGPYAESVEQLTGFYTIQSDDLEDLLKIVGILAEGEGRVEVRACVDHS
jgi:hypothetical protein